MSNFDDRLFGRQIIKAAQAMQIGQTESDKQTRDAFRLEYVIAKGDTILPDVAEMLKGYIDTAVKFDLMSPLDQNF